MLSRTCVTSHLIADDHTVHCMIIGNIRQVVRGTYTIRNSTTMSHGESSLLGLITYGFRSCPLLLFTFQLVVPRHKTYFNNDHLHASLVY